VLSKWLGDTECVRLAERRGNPIADAIFEWLPDCHSERVAKYFKLRFAIANP
jgi:hypothetical protein